jgi:metallo-beta-lactamase class B
VVEDYFYNRENSALYIGDEYVTAIGATWTPETAKLLAEELKKVTNKPIKEVINTNYHPDRAGGNGYFHDIGAKILSTQQTYELLKSNWKSIVKDTQNGIPSYPDVSLVLLDKVFDSDFTLQNGSVQAIYLGQSHTSDGIFVYFPNEGILFGNCILKEKLGNLEFANREEYPKTLKKLKALKIKKIIAGHWSPIHGPELVDEYIRLLDQTSKK